MESVKTGQTRVA